MEDKLELYIRPQQSPAATFNPENIRINYSGKWVDFRNGKILIRNESGERIGEFKFSPAAGMGRPSHTAM